MSEQLDDYKALELIRTKSEDALSRGNTGLSLGAEPSEGGGEQKELKKRRKSSTIATERLLASQGVAQDEDALPKGKIPVISPHNPIYLKWWYFTMVFAIIMATLDPIQLAFIDRVGFTPTNDFWAAMDIIAIIVFGFDLCSKFFLSYNDPEEGMIRCHKRIALNYLKGLFWVDLITTMPIESIVTTGLGITSTEDDRAIFLGLIRWLKIGRLYRIFDLFIMLDHKMVLSQISMTLMRNFTFMFFVAHWMACIFFFLSRAEGMSQWSWVGSAQDRFDRNPGWASYFFSFYFSMVIFTGFGDNDFFAHNPLETCFVVGYLFCNIILQAYVLGSITTVMVRGDERSNEFRTRVESLNEFAEAKEIPEELHETMRAHLELRYHSERTADDQVLKAYPPTIRKKVLRHMYQDVLRNCYLFSGCKARFLDEVLSLARMELFMPHMTILSEGEVVNELMIIVDGEIQGARSGSAAALAHSNSARRSDQNMDLTTDMQQRVKSRRGSIVLGEGGGNLQASAISRANSQAGLGKQSTDPHGMQANGSIHMPPPPGTATQGRRRSSVMFDASAADATAAKAQSAFGSQRSGTQSLKGGQTSLKGGPGSIGRNSSNGYGSMGSGVFPGGDDGSVTVLSSSDCVAEVPFLTEAPCLQNYWTGCLVRVLILTKGQVEKLESQFPLQVKQMLANMKEHADELFRLAVADALARCAAPQPDATGIMYDNDGNPINSDTTKAIFLPEEVLETLHDALAGGQSFTAKKMRRPMKSLKDALPVDHKFQLQRLELLRTLAVKYIRGQELQRVFNFISAAADQDMAKIRTLIAQGVSPSSSDYDKRTALMVAAHEGNDGVIRILLDFRANASAQDAFGMTAMFEAVRMGHDHVIDLLKKYRVKLGLDQNRVAEVMNAAVAGGDTLLLGRMIRAGGDPNWGDYDLRTPLHLAAADGNQVMVEMLVEQGKAAVDVVDRWDATPLDNARAAGAQPVVEYLEPLHEEVKQGKRKSWTQTAWHARCREEAQRVHSPPVQGASPDTLLITDSGYTKRGPVAQRQSSGLPGDAANLPGRRGSMMLPTGGASALKVFRCETGSSQASFLGEEGSPQVAGSKRLQSLSGSEAGAHALRNEGSAWVPMDPANTINEEPDASRSGRVTWSRTTSASQAEDMHEGSAAFGCNSSMMRPSAQGDAGFEEEPAFGRNGSMMRPSHPGNGRLEGVSVDLPAFGRNGSMMRPSHPGNDRREGVSTESPAFGRNGSMMRPSHPGNAGLQEELAFVVQDGSMLPPSQPGNVPWEGEELPAQGGGEADGQQQEPDSPPN